MSEPQPREIHPNLPACLTAENVFLHPMAWVQFEAALELLGQVCGSLVNDGRMSHSRATAIYRLSKQLDAGQLRKLTANIIKKQGAV